MGRARGSSRETTVERRDGLAGRHRADGGTRITHRATLDGPLASVWSPAIGRIIQRGLPGGVERLAELAVEKQKEAREEEKAEKEREERLKEADEKFKEEIEKTAAEGKDAGGASLPGSG